MLAGVTQKTTGSLATRLIDKHERGSSQSHLLESLPVASIRPYKLLNSKSRGVGTLQKGKNLRRPHKSSSARSVRQLKSSFWGEVDYEVTFSGLLLMVISAACQISAVYGSPSAEWCAPSLYASTSQHLNSSITNPAWMCPLDWPTRQRLPPG